MTGLFVLLLLFLLTGFDALLVALFFAGVFAFAIGFFLGVAFFTTVFLLLPSSSFRLLSIWG